MKSPPDPERDWKDICRRYQVGAQAKSEQPVPTAALKIINDKHKMAKQIVCILLEEDEPDHSEAINTSAPGGNEAPSSSGLHQEAVSKNATEGEHWKWKE